MKPTSTKTLHASSAANATKAPSAAGLDPQFLAALEKLREEVSAISGDIDSCSYAYDALNICNDAAQGNSCNSAAANAAYYLVNELGKNLGPLKQRSEEHTHKFYKVLCEFVPDYGSGPSETPAGDVSTPAAGVTVTGTQTGHSGAAALQNSADRVQGVTFKDLSAVENAILGHHAVADGIKAQLAEIISQRGDADESLNEDLNRLLWNFTHAFAVTQKNAEEELGKLFFNTREVAKSKGVAE